MIYYFLFSIWSFFFIVSLFWVFFKFIFLFNFTIQLKNSGCHIIYFYFNFDPYSLNCYFLFWILLYNLIYFFLILSSNILLVGD